MTTQPRYVRIPDRYTIPADLEHRGYVSTFELCITLGMGMEGLRYWRRDRNWPTGAVTVRSNVTFYHLETVFEFLRSTPANHRGTRPQWLAIVGHPKATAKDRARVAEAS